MKSYSEIDGTRSFFLINLSRWGERAILLFANSSVPWPEPLLEIAVQWPLEALECKEIDELMGPSK